MGYITAVEKLKERNPSDGKGRGKPMAIYTGKIYSTMHVHIDAPNLDTWLDVPIVDDVVSSVERLIKRNKQVEESSNAPSIDNPRRYPHISDQ